MANLVARILAGLLLVLRRRHGGSEESGRTRVAAAVAIVALLIAAPSSSLIGMYVRPPIAAYVTQYAAQHDIARIGRIAEQPSKQAIPSPIQELQQADLLGRSPAVQPPGKSDGSGEQTAAWDAVPTTMVSQATEILEKERRRADGLENELAELRPSIERCELRLRDAAATAPQSQQPDRDIRSALPQDLAAARQELTAYEVQYRKALAEECDRSAALASELATAQRNVETQVVQSNKTANEAAQLKKAADTAASELQREHERAEALASELAKVRREVETAAAVSSQKEDEAVQTAEAAIADLQQLLQQEQNKTAALTQEVGAARQAMTANAEQQRRALDEARARAAALASELAGTRREIETQATQSQKADDEAVQQKQTAEAAIADLQQLLQQEQNKTAALTQEVGAGNEAVDVKQKSTAVEERPGVSLPANSDAFVKPGQPAKQLDVTPENSKPAIKPVETVPLPRKHAMSPDNGYSCQRYRTYDPASGTYKGYDGQRHSCRPPESGRKSGNALQRQQASPKPVNPDITGRTNVAQPEDSEASGTLRQADEQAEAVETSEKPTNRGPPP